MAKLLFVNTFSHDHVEDFNIDFVKFSAGMLATVREIRIIPGGARIPVVEAPQRQGLTSPNSFSLELFAKNSKRTDMSVFERIAIFDYHFDSNICFQIPGYTTDGILFKGKYNILTVAIYGDPVSGDTHSDVLHSPITSPIPTFSGINPVAAGLSAPGTLPPGAFAPSATDAGSSLLAATANVPFSPQPPTQILSVGTPIPTWVGPPATVQPVLHMAPPPPTFNPLVPPPISVIPGYPTPAPNAPPAGIVEYRIQPHAPGVVVQFPFDPTRPPPNFHTPQHSPQLAAPPPSQISPSEKRSPQMRLQSRRQHNRQPKSKRHESGESARSQTTEGKPIETAGTAKPTMSSVSAAPDMPPVKSAATTISDDIQLEDGEYAGSEGSEKFDLENISEEEFEFDDALAAQMNDHDLQEDLLVNMRFDPYKFTMAPLKFFKDPSLSHFEIETLELLRLTQKES